MLSNLNVSIIKRLILDDSCTQIALAKWFGCSLQTIYKLKNGVSRRDIQASGPVADTLIERINTLHTDTILD